MGGCPCPRCCVTLDRTGLLGTERDKQQRVTLSRVDDLKHRSKISSAREMIYGKNWAVDSAPIQRLLKPESLVPTEVGRNLICCSHLQNCIGRTHFQPVLHRLASTSSQSSWWTSCMRLSWAFGVHFLSIFFEFLNVWKVPLSSLIGGWYGTFTATSLANSRQLGSAKFPHSVEAPSATFPATFRN